MKRTATGRRVSAGSTPLPDSLQCIRDLNNTTDVGSPIKKRLDFINTDDSHDEVFINRQANKKKKMSVNDELKIWFRKEIAGLATGEQVEGIKVAVESNSARSEANENKINEIGSAVSAIQMEMETDRREFDARVMRLMGSTPSGSGGYAAAAGNGISFSRGRNIAPEITREERREREQFERARRSIRIWPIKGVTEGEMMDSLRGFFSEALELGGGGDYGVATITRARSAPRGRAYLEVIVEFTDKYARDDVFGRGGRLEEHKDEDGRATCGLRLHIPAHLMNAFKALEAYGFDLKRTHKDAIKKYIKFDEQERTLFLQVKHSKDQEAVNFSVEHAIRETKKKNVSRVSTSHVLRPPSESPNRFLTGANAGPLGGAGGSGLGGNDMETGSSPIRRIPTWKPPPRMQEQNTNK